jgi:mono/diheme cytochrome c family protein
LTACIAALAFTGVMRAAPPAEAPKATVSPSDRDHAAKMAKGLDLFKAQVRPVMIQRCVRCHGGKSTESEFDLTDREGLLRGGRSGAAIVAGNSRESLLYKLITHAREPYMPHSAPKLSDNAIVAIAAWIDFGAPYDKSLLARQPDASAWTRKTVPPTAREFWSFKPLQRARPPQVTDRNCIRTPIDRFVLAKLEAVGVQPSPPADKRHLIRRAYFDLTGLPPAPEEVETFLNDPAPDAYQKLLDRLLASPHYGERWGRHWLDLARFAESHGFEHDYDRPSAYHYRDFVIKALNADLPYDTFVKWQLAGDEFEPDNHLALMATGFLAAGVHSTQITKNEVEKQRYDEMDDMAATVGTALLGLTVGCARCHDHKYDPIPQADYYRFLATFTTAIRSEIDLDFDPKIYLKAKAKFELEQAPLVAALRKFEAEELPAHLAKRTNKQNTAWALWYRFSDPDWRKPALRLWDHLRRAPKPNFTKVLVASEGLRPIRLHTQGDDFFRETYFLRRGDPEQKEGLARPSFLQVLMTVPEREKHWQLQPPKGCRTSYRRRALADWITDVDHGAGNLLARVIVNRLWQHHMGGGIVATPSEFGSRGERPSHPELLDWLASELINNGWRLKPIHKLIMSSSVYRQSSGHGAQAFVDQARGLFGRGPRFRLEAEAIRDSLLAVSGSLDSRMLGPGTLDINTKRRSIYFTVKHSNLIPMMTVFDAPDALQSVGERPTTTIAPQALFLMNNANVRGYARSLAQRLAPYATRGLELSFHQAYLMALSRPPYKDELTEALAFVKQQTESYRVAGRTDAQEAALTDFCQVLMCLNEFIYVD